MSEFVYFEAYSHEVVGVGSTMEELDQGPGRRPRGRGSHWARTLMGPMYVSPSPMSIERIRLPYTLFATQKRPGCVSSLLCNQRLGHLTNKSNRES